MGKRASTRKSKKGVAGYLDTASSRKWDDGVSVQ